MNLSINKTELKIALCLIPFFTFAVGFKWPLLGIALNVWRYAVIAVALVLLIYCKKIITLFKDRSFCVLLFLYAVLFISTVANGEAINNAIQLAMYGIVPYLVMCRYWHTENGWTRVLGGVSMAFTIILLANFVIMILYPNGIHSTYSSAASTNYYLIGAKNQMVPPIIIGMVFFVENSFHKYGKLSLWSFVKCLICACELILGGSGTGIIMIIAFVILEILQRKKQLISTKVSFIALLMIFIGIVFFQMQNSFAFFIEDILHKSLTLSNRTLVWDAAFLSIQQHPIMGIGVSSNLAGNVLLNLNYTSKNTFAHNTYLDFAVMGGIIAITLFIIFLFQVKHEYDIAWKQKTRSIIWWGIWLYLLAAIVEIYQGNYCLFLMTAFISTRFHNLKYVREKGHATN